MSHGASAGFADVIEPSNVCEVFPELRPYFDAVTGDAVWGLLECSQLCDFEDAEEIYNELRDVLDMDEDDETVEEFDKRAKAMAVRFHEAFTRLQAAFMLHTGASIGTSYLDPDSLDGYADVSGRHWYIHNHMVLRAKVKKAVSKGLIITRGFYAVYG